MKKSFSIFHWKAGDEILFSQEQIKRSPSKEMAIKTRSLSRRTAGCFTKLSWDGRQHNAPHGYSRLLSDHPDQLHFGAHFCLNKLRTFTMTCPEEAIYLHQPLHNTSPFTTHLHYWSPFCSPSQGFCTSQSLSVVPLVTCNNFLTCSP